MEGKANHPTSAGGAEVFGGERARAESTAIVIPLADMSPADLDRPRAVTASLHGPDETRGPVWRWTVSVEGVCLHGATTATDRRRDALLSATRFIEAAKRIVRFEPNRMDATIAHQPGAARLPNAIGGRYTLQLELRDADESVVDRVYERLTHEALTIGRLSRTRFVFEPHRTNPVPSYGQYVFDATRAAASGGR